MRDAARPRRSRNRLAIVIGAGTLLVGAVVAAVSSGVFGDVDDTDPEATAVAERYAAALSIGNSRSLAAVACEQPSETQAEAFQRRAGSGELHWRVQVPPRVEDDTAHGTLRAADGTKHRDFPFTLHRRERGWCAHYNWDKLGDASP